jgi:hypothetical protein
LGKYSESLLKVGCWFLKADTTTHKLIRERTSHMKKITETLKNKREFEAEFKLRSAVF